MEMHEKEKIITKMTLKDLKIEWVDDDALNKFYFKPQKKDKHVRQEGDVVRLRHQDWEATGVIFDLPSNQMKEPVNSSDKKYEGIGVVLDAPWTYVGPVPKHINKGFTLHWEFNQINFVRIKNSLANFCHNFNTNGDDDEQVNISAEVRDKILGSKSKKKTFGPAVVPALNRTKANLPPLNKSQRKAMMSCLLNCLTLVQGPPGTGKTVTGVNIIYNLFRETNAKRETKVLVCASSNVAVDNMAEKLALIKGLNVVRVYSKAKEMFAKKGNVKLLKISLHKLSVKKEPQLKDLYQSQRYLSKQEFLELSRLKTRTEHVILESADIICCTCSAAGDTRLDGLVFNSLLIAKVVRLPNQRL